MLLNAGWHQEHLEITFNRFSIEHGNFPAALGLLGNRAGKLKGNTESSKTKFRWLGHQCNPLPYANTSLSEREGDIDRYIDRYIDKYVYISEIICQKRPPLMPFERLPLGLVSPALREAGSGKGA